MTATRFDLVSHWRLDAPVERVWAVIAEVETWPLWWPAVRKVDLLEPGDASGVGAVRRIAWKTALPYDLVFDARTIRVEPLRAIEARAFGELDGVGLWTFAADGDATTVRYDWRVEVTKPWMRLLAPVLRPVFAWNHGKVMGWGEEGIRRRLAG